MRSQCHRRRRWNIDKWPKNKMQKERKHLNDKQRRKQRSNEREDVKTQNYFVCEKNLDEIKATKFAIETEKKTFS